MQVYLKSETKGYMIIEIKGVKSKLVNGTKYYIQRAGFKWRFSLHLNELSVLASFISVECWFQVLAPRKDITFCPFASCHSGDVKIVCCISQININISVSIFCEQIRKIARCKTSYCFISHRSCFTFNNVGDSKPFKVLNQKSCRCIITAMGDNSCSPILQFLQRP